MPESHSILTAAELRELLDYDPRTGVFKWKRRSASTQPQRTWNTRYAGKIAGSPADKGSHALYWRIRVRGRGYAAHRLAWLYAHGEWPSGRLDHRDGNGQNNAIGNLRLASAAENSWNARIKKSNTTGFKGVLKSCANRFHATIRHNGKRHYLGRRKTPEEAAKTYAEAAKRLHGEFARFD